MNSLVTKSNFSKTHAFEKEMAFFKKGCPVELENHLFGISFATFSLRKALLSYGIPKCCVFAGGFGKHIYFG